MRQTLFRIWLEQPWAGWTDIQGEPPHVGACWILIVLGTGFFLYHQLTQQHEIVKDKVNWLIFGCGILGLSVAPGFGFLPKSVPVFGYGAMMLIGFTSAMWFSVVRAKASGHDPDVILDAAVWILFIGVLGGRTAYLIQYGDRVFANARGLEDIIFRAINLSEGGLVQIGGLVGGTLGFYIFSFRRKINFFEFADIMAPAIFIGIGFGRLGCLLNGCCFGDRCDLAWGVEFPMQSLAFQELMNRGFLPPDATSTFTLHPTQVYSSINGFVLAFVTGVYYWYRRHAGDVFALGCLLYAITRVQIEFLRADEMGQLGTGFTISQFYSAGIFLTGLAIMFAARWQAQGIQKPQPQAT